MTTPAKKYLSDALNDVYFGLLTYQENIFSFRLALTYLNQIAFTSTPVNQGGCVVTDYDAALDELIAEGGPFENLQEFFDTKKFQILNYDNYGGSYDQEPSLQNFRGDIVVYDSLKRMLYGASDDVDKNVEYFTNMMNFHKKRSNRVLILVDFDMDDEDIARLTKKFNEKQFIYLSNCILESEMKDGFRFVENTDTKEPGVSSQMSKEQVKTIIEAAKTLDVKIEDLATYNYVNFNPEFTKYFNIAYPSSMEKVLSDPNRTIDIADVINIYGGDTFAMTYTPKFNNLCKVILDVDQNDRHIIYTVMDDNYGSGLIYALLNRLAIYEDKDKILLIGSEDTEEEVMQKAALFNNTEQYSILIITGYIPYFLKRVDHFHIMDDGLEAADKLLVETCKSNPEKTLQVYLHYSVDRDSNGDARNPVTFYDEFRMVYGFMGDVVKRRQISTERFKKGYKVNADLGKDAKCIIHI